MHSVTPVKLSYPSLDVTDYVELRDEWAMQLRELLVRLGQLLTMQLASAAGAKFAGHLAPEEFGNLFVHAMPLS